jgi:hypothetical protein
MLLEKFLHALGRRAVLGRGLPNRFPVNRYLHPPNQSVASRRKCGRQIECSDDGT